MALTFTKKAANEMKERVANMVGYAKARKLCMGTFHSVFIRFLRDYAEGMGYPKTFTIYDTSDSISMIKSCLKELELDDKVYKPKEVLSRISIAKNSLVTVAAYGRDSQLLQNDAACKKPKLYDIYKLYSQKCKQAGVMDFDDILLNMNILLRDNREALEEISARFDHIMVDEYQDTNLAQYYIIKKLSSKHRNICVVGDDSQSIYAFRGARIGNILNFQKDYPDFKQFNLVQNYRSTQMIVQAANSVIAQNTERIPKTCFSAGDSGDKLRIIQAYDDREEASLVTSSIIAKMREDRAEYQDFAILYRTNAQSRSLEEALRRRNLPYMIYSGNSFYERAEVKDLMAYFKLAVNPHDDESFKRIVNKPARGIGDTSLVALTAAAHSKGCSLMEAASCNDLETFGLKTAGISHIQKFVKMAAGFSQKTITDDAYSLAVAIAMDSGLYMYYKSDTSVEGQGKTANVEELLNSVKTFVEERQNEYYEQMLSDGAVGEGVDIPDVDMPPVLLSEYLENVSLLSAVDIDESEDATNRIALMTVHSAKGLEFPYVYVVGLEENLFPSGGSFAPMLEIEEERRLFYVAVTRAKKMVWLTFATQRMRNGKHESNSPSRFLKEIDSQFIANPLPKNEGTDSVSILCAGSLSNFGGTSSYHKYGTPPSHTAPQKSPQGFGQTSKSDSHIGSARKPVTTNKAPKNIAKPLPVADFVPDSVLDLRKGQRIEHNRFGLGTILDISGEKVDKRAVIKFDNYGEKVLLLKYAKVRIVK